MVGDGVQPLLVAEEHGRRRRLALPVDDHDERAIEARAVIGARRVREVVIDVRQLRPGLPVLCHEALHVRELPVDGGDAPGLEVRGAALPAALEVLRRRVEVIRKVHVLEPGADRLLASADGELGHAHEVLLAVEPLFLDGEGDLAVLHDRGRRVVADVAERDADVRVLRGVAPDMLEGVGVEPRKAADAR